MMRHRCGPSLPALLALAVIGCSSGSGSATSQSTGSGSGGAATSTGSSAADTSSTTSTSGSGGSGGSQGAMPTHLPTAKGTCPEMANLDGKTATFAGQGATVWSGDPSKGPGPLLIYWYATGSSSLEPIATIRTPQIKAMTDLGGAIVALQKTTAQGKTTGNNVWYTGDADIADEIVACAIEKQKIDPRRIHSAGYSAGALQTTYMWFARSGYVASVLTYSGGDDFLDKAPLEDEAHPPAALVTHGPMGVDTYGGVIDFYTASVNWEGEIKMAKGFVIDCTDTGAHTDVSKRTAIAPQAVQFFLDHPYGVTPEPYTSLPAGFPDYCSIK
jgi:hypothetical protein